MRRHRPTVCLTRPPQNGHGSTGWQSSYFARSPQSHTETEHQERYRRVCLTKKLGGMLKTLTVFSSRRGLSAVLVVMFLSPRGSKRRWASCSVHVVIACLGRPCRKVWPYHSDHMLKHLPSLFSRQQVCPYRPAVRVLYRRERNTCVRSEVLR